MWTLVRERDGGQWALVMDNEEVYSRHVNRSDALTDAKEVADHQEALAARLREDVEDAQAIANECRALLAREGS